MMSGRLLVATIVWSVFLSVGTVFLSVGTVMYILTLPLIEARLAPVLTHQRIETQEGDRTPGRMCWTWLWEKERYAQPIAMSWAIVIDGTSVEFPIVVERQRDGSVIRKPNIAAIGPGQNDFCTNIPPELDSVPGLEIHGAVNYRTSHNLWTVWQPTPPVVVPALPAPAPR